MSRSSWNVHQDDDTPEVPVQVQTVSATGRSLDAGLRGRGLLRPFRRGKQDFVSGEGEELVIAHVGQILGTIAQSPDTSGTLPWRTEFGSWLHLLRHRNNSEVLADQARAFAARAISRWEPRCRIRSAQVERDGEKLVLRVRWDLTSRVGSDARVLVPGLVTTVGLG